MLCVLACSEVFLSRSGSHCGRNTLPKKGLRYWHHFTVGHVALCAHWLTKLSFVSLLFFRIYHLRSQGLCSLFQIMLWRGFFCLSFSTWHLCVIVLCFSVKRHVAHGRQRTAGFLGGTLNLFWLLFCPFSPVSVALSRESVCVHAAVVPCFSVRFIHC